MSIKLVFTKVGCSIGEVTLTDCDNIRNVVPDLAMSIYGIVDGYGYDADQVAEEWANISHSFDEILETYKNQGFNLGGIYLINNPDYQITVIFS